MNYLKSLRDYIKLLEEAGELHTIETCVDWNLEIGAIIRKINDLKGPAILFNNIKDYPKGYRVLGSPVGVSAKEDMFYARIAISLGLPKNASAAEIIEELSHLRDNPLIPPKIVQKAACKENIFTGDAVNLLSLPAPYLHDGDGGRYIGTWHTVITKSPDGECINWGMYRIMIHDSKNLTGLIVPTQHIGMHFSEWKKINKDMPFAIVIGTDPVIPLVSSMNIPYGMCEGDVVGGYIKEPLEVVKCETVDLYVPAYSEIVIEGHVSISDTKPEGPFGEYTGFMTFASKEQPVFQVSAVTHRDNPILTAVCPGEPVDDHVCMSLSLAGDALNILRKSNIPVIMTFIPPMAALHLLIISVDKRAFKGKDIIQAIGKCIWSDKIGTLLPKIIVVDKDVNPTNLNQVLWNFSTKCHPEHGTVIFPPTQVFPLSPYLSKEEKTARSSPTIIYDCTWPNEWQEDFIPKKVSIESIWPKEIQEKIEKNWKEYGL
jgi:4-hydroxy-3-polyprenylbenzoate decarboxylase